MPTDRPLRLPAGYEFSRLLGTGNGGWVALARQPGVSRPVAIKMTYTGLRSREASARLRREGRAIAALDHPGIVRVFELVADVRGFWLVMEHVAGPNLARAVREPGWTGSRAVRVLSELAGALEHAHGRAVVHRDVKPANVLLTPDGRVKLADFGIARLPATVDPFRSADAISLGTPLYMAPEQIMDPGLDARSIDAYAFALIAYELLTGSLPFPQRDSAAILSAHLYESPVPAQQYVAAFPDTAAAALLCGLHKDPHQRLTPTRLVAELRRVDAAGWDAIVASRLPETDQPACRATVTVTTDDEPIPLPAVPDDPRPFVIGIGDLSIPRAALRPEGLVRRVGRPRRARLLRRVAVWLAAATLGALAALVVIIWGLHR